MRKDTQERISSDAIDMSDSSDLSEKIVLFRAILQNIKQTLLDSLLYKSQDNANLNKAIQHMNDLYSLLMPIITRKKGLESLQAQPHLQKLIRPVFDDNDEDDPVFFSQLEYYAKRDLIMFPLTLDTKRINSFDDKNSLI